MCGPPDFGALHTCIVRLGELSVGGLATYSACRTASLYYKLHPKREEREKRARHNVLDRLVAEGPSGQFST